MSSYLLLSCPILGLLEHSSRVENHVTVLFSHQSTTVILKWTGVICLFNTVKPQIIGHSQVSIGSLQV